MSRRPRWVAAAVLAAGSLAGCGGADAPSERGGRPPVVTREDRRPPGGEDTAPTARRARHPASPAVARAERFLAEGDAATARPLLEAAVRDDPDDPRARLDLGLALEALGDLDGAERAFQHAIRLDDGFAEAHNDLGLLLAARGRADQAERELSLAIQYGPELAEPRVNLAMQLEERGRAEEALGLYRAAQRLEPEDPQIATNLGLLLLRMGDVGEAREVLESALTLARHEPALLVSVGNGLRRAGRPALAVDALQRAVSGWSGTPPSPVLAELALAQRAAGDRAGAEATLARVLRVDDGYATGHFLLGSLLAAREAFAEAIPHFERALALDPEGPLAPRAREALSAARAARQSAD